MRLEMVRDIVREAVHSTYIWAARGMLQRRVQSDCFSFSCMDGKEGVYCTLMLGIWNAFFVADGATLMWLNFNSAWWKVQPALVGAGFKKLPRARYYLHRQGWQGWSELPPYKHAYEWQSECKQAFENVFHSHAWIACRVLLFTPPCSWLSEALFSSLPELKERLARFELPPV